MSINTTRTLVIRRMLRSEPSQMTRAQIDNIDLAAIALASKGSQVRKPRRPPVHPANGSPRTSQRGVIVVLIS